jgi:hypothetical protein
MMNPSPFGLLIRYTDDTNKNAPNEAELHANLWELDNKSHLDIGLMLHQYVENRKIVIQVPFELTKDNICDLGGALRGQPDLISAVFNEDFTTTTDQSHPHITCSKGTEKFSIIKLSVSSLKVELEANIEQGAVVSTITITPPTDSPKMGKIYLRIRLLNIPKHFYSNQLSQIDRLVLSSWKRTQLVDFRINAKRGVPESILSQLNYKWICFSKIHLFLMKHKSHHQTFHDSNFKGCRSLEDEGMWASYLQITTITGERVIKDSPNVRDLLAYQWTKKQERDGAPISDLSIMGRFSADISNNIQVLIFCGFIVVLGALGSGLWNCIASDPQYNHPLVAITIVFVGISLILWLSNLKKS